MSSLERAAFHEAGHVAFQWSAGGDVSEVSVAEQEGEWQGYCAAPPLNDAMLQAGMLLAGGLAESIFVVRQQDNTEWFLQEQATKSELESACQPTFGFKDVSIYFENAEGNRNAPLTEPVDDLFSDDSVRVWKLVNNAGLDRASAITDAIRRMNSDVPWVCISLIGSRLIKSRTITEDDLLSLQSEFDALSNSN